MPFSAYATLTGALSRYGRKLLRCKGVLPLGPSGEPHVVQGVQGYFAPPEKAPRALPAGAVLVCILDGITADELGALVDALPGMPEHTLLRSSKDKTR